jgi:hypothetical protein
MAAAVDPYPGTVASPAGPHNHAAAVTPSDANDLANVASAVYVGGAGALVVITAGGETVTFAAVPAGTTIPLRVARVKATGTAATSIVAVW